MFIIPFNFREYYILARGIMGTVITTHRNMDLDALGSVIAVKKLYPDSTVVLPDTKGSDVARLLAENPDVLEFLEESKFDGEFEKLVIVDTDSVTRIPKKLQERVSSNVEIIVYDHHSPNFELPADVSFKEAGATTSFLVLLLKGRGIVPSPLEASVMLAGIYADTGSFRYPSTSPIDFLAAAYLLSFGANIEFVKSYLPLDISDKELDILKVLKDNLKVVEVEGNRIGITYARFDSYVGDVAHLVSRLLEIAGLPALFGVIEVESTVFLIGRSRTQKVDASEVTSFFGGGGHSEAASASLKNRTAFEVLEELKDVLTKVVKPLKRARDIMTSPPKTVLDSVTVSEARIILMRSGINAAPVVDSKGKILGIINRALLDKAVYMGLEKEKVVNVMERDFRYVKPGDSLSLVESIVINDHQSFVPVVEDGKPVGVITRTDILMNLYTKELSDISSFYEKRLTLEPKVRNFSQKLKQFLPKNLYGLVKKIGEFADEEGVNAYIVGGFVRDLVIGRKNFDIDIVIEGDATVFAKHLAKAFGAKVHTFDRFKTATVVFPDGTRIDFASARTEVYKAPGALPEVDMASLKKDLMRRDFTINTLAIKINAKEFGKLIDFFGGLKDIRDKKIRVLHSLSFVEDPTRILRALRFATRYRFDLGKHTEKLLKIAVERKLFKTVEGQRIYHELKQIFLEDNPLRVVNKLYSYGILQSLFEGVVWDRGKKDFFERIRKIVIWHKLNFPEMQQGVRYYLLYFGALFYGEPAYRVRKYLELLSLPEKEEQYVWAFLKEAPKLLSQVNVAKSIREVFSVLEGKKEELLLFLASLPEREEEREKVLKFLKEWRFVKPLVDGEDLKALGLKPGPVFRKILSEIKYAIIEGKLDREDREEQLAYLKEIVNETVQ